jgi:hypothetical protein
VHPPTWILAFGLVLLGNQAAAVPCGDDSCQGQEDREDASIQLKPTQPRARSYDASRMLGNEFWPGTLRTKGERSPGLQDDGRAREWRKRVATSVGDSEAYDELPFHPVSTA